jgi:lysophospholipase L1-like esterase
MKKLLLAVCGLIFCFFVSAQSVIHPFQKDIDAFKVLDKQEPPSGAYILLVGSSSFTKWTDVRAYFPGYNIVNRGFGGSSLTDLIYFADDVIYAYTPAQIVIYCGENDIVAADSITAKMVLQRFQTLFAGIRKHFPTTPVIFISIKPSPSRWKFEPVIVEANRLIKQFLDKQTASSFLNVHDAMLNKDGSVRSDLFIRDQLHMNANGYAIWQKGLKPLLKH